MSVFLPLLLTLRSCARSRALQQLEVLALRHQLQVLQRSRPRRPRPGQADRLLERRRVVHVAVTDHPSAEWTAQQLREAFPWDQAPRYLIRDRDHAFAAPTFRPVMR